MFLDELRTYCLQVLLPFQCRRLLLSWNGLICEEKCRFQNCSCFNGKSQVNLLLKSLSLHIKNTRYFRDEKILFSYLEKILTSLSYSILKRLCSAKKLKKKIKKITLIFHKLTMFTSIIS